MRLVQLVLAAIVLALGPGDLRAAEFSCVEDGVRVEVKGMGGFTLSWPRLQPGDRQPVDRRIDGRRAELAYADGAKLGVEARPDGTIALRFRDVPEGIRDFTVGTLIGAEYGDGGTWAIGKDGARPFPREQPAKPHLFQGNAGVFTLRDAAGHGLTFTVPDYCYQQLTDNREWGWKIFAWQLHMPFNRGWAEHVIGVKELVGGAVARQVDRFGQTTRRDFPGKVRDEAELAEDARTEDAWYASLAPAATDAWGGVPGSGARLGLRKTGFFHVQRTEDRWLLVDPDGNACFHLGVCSFGYVEDPTYVREREDIYEWIPPVDGEYAHAWHPEPYWHDKAFSYYLANVGRKYGLPIDRDRQIARLVERVKRVGFNAVGAFSGNHPAFAAAHFPRVEMVGMGPALPGITGVPDPFDADTLASFERDCAGRVARSASDPLIVGYFFGNEQAFEDIPRAVPQLPGRHAAKRELIAQLRQAYPTIAGLNAAWGTRLADWDAALATGLPVSTAQAAADMQRYTERFLDAYFTAITTTFRRHDPNHLLIGNRWQPGTATNETLCRVAGRHLDVISVNYYTMGVDAAFMRRIHDWTGGRPQLWSEFYYTSGDESNCQGSGQDLQTQRARGQAYRAYVEQAASLGFVVGTEWFTLLDQAVTGRWFSKLNGERGNTGLFNVADRPYRDCLAEMAAAHRGVYDVLLAGKAPYVLDDPRFASGQPALASAPAGRATGPIALDGTTTNWPGRPPERIGPDRLVSGKDSTGLEASFKACWDDQHLHLLVAVTDATPLNNRHDGDALWNGDGVEVFLSAEAPDESGPLRFGDRQILLGARKDGVRAHVRNAATQPTIVAKAIPNVDGSGYVLQAAIPWTALGTTPKADATLRFDLAIDDAAAEGDRFRQLMWSGTARNSADRSRWGRLQLVP